MAKIHLTNVSLAYPVHARFSLGKKKQGKVGGKMFTDTRGRQWVLALDNVSIDVNPGDRIGLKGHNGAGKSTLLRILAGTETPTAGQVVSDGRVTSLLNPGAGMQPFATGYENIRLRGLLQGMSKDEIEAAVPEIREFTELGEYLNVPVSQYSGGMRLRLSFAIATAMRPEILLMDELMGAGDKNFRRKASERLEKFLESASILVLASHNPRVIKTFCKTAYRLERGKIYSTGIEEES